MEELKKTIKQALTVSGGTASSNEFKIIPDTGATYYVKLSLIQETKSLGFFNSFVESEETFDDSVFEWIPLIPAVEYDPIPIFDG